MVPGVESCGNSIATALFVTVMPKGTELLMTPRSVQHFMAKSAGDGHRARVERLVEVQEHLGAGRRGRIHVEMHSADSVGAVMSSTVSILEAV